MNSFQFHAPSLIESLLRGRYILKPVSKLSRGFSESASRSVMSNSCDPMDRSPPGSSVHGISQARILEWVAIPFSRGIFPTQGPNLGLLHCRQVLYRLNHQGQASVQFSCSVVSDPLRPHEPQHARLPCPSPTPRVHPSPCPSSR